MGPDYAERYQRILSTHAWVDTSTARLALYVDTHLLQFWAKVR